MPSEKSIHQSISNQFGDLLDSWLFLDEEVVAMVGQRGLGPNLHCVLFVAFSTPSPLPKIRYTFTILSFWRALKALLPGIKIQCNQDKMWLCQENAPRFFLFFSFFISNSIYCLLIISHSESILRWEAIEKIFFLKKMK